MPVTHAAWSPARRLVRLSGRLGAALVAVVALLALGAVPASAAGAGYVALGDSYSSGVGAGDYIGSSGACERSPNAYPALWAARTGTSVQSVACSGAATSDVTANQLPALTSSTRLVSLTVGGNDVGFASIMTDCILKGSSACVSEVAAAESQARAILPGRLDALYAAIRTRAPQARLVVLDYPHFYDLSHWFCIGLAQASRTRIDEGIDVLDGLIQAAASRAGAVFADVRSAFAGHEICDSNRWLHSVNITQLTESYHPTADGHADAYLPVFTSAAGSTL